MFLKTNLGYLSQIALENMQLLILTARHFLVFLTLCSQLKFSENPGKIALNPREYLQELTHLTVGTNKFQIIIRFGSRTLINQLIN